MQRAERAALPSVVLRRLPSRAVLSAIPAAARPGSAADHRLDRRRCEGQCRRQGADADAERDGAMTASSTSIRDMFAALRACWVPPPKDEARHGMEYTIRFAFKRDGEMVAPPRMTYASHDAPADGARHLSRGDRCGAQALHAAAFQRRHGRRGRRPPDRHPLRRRAHDRSEAGSSDVALIARIESDVLRHSRASGTVR